jgi:anti-repressor protein
MTHIDMHVSQPVRNPVVDVTPYQFDGRNIRIVQQDGEAWFVASDVAAELGHREAKDMTRLLDADEKGRQIVPTPSGDQEMTIISEAGLYRALVQRRATKKMDERLKARVQRFQRWVFHDVLPSIRKTGGYGQSVTVDDLLANPAQLLELTKGYALKIAEQDRQIAGMQGDVDALGRIAQADGSFCITDAAKTLQLRPKDLFSFLRAHGWIYSRPGTSDIAYQSKLASGLLEHKTTTVYRSDGSEKVTTQVRVTPKGLARLAKEFPSAVSLAH